MIRLRDLSMASDCVRRPDINLRGESYQFAPLTPKELDTFKIQLADILMVPGADERRVMEDRIEQYVYALRAIKQELNAPAFTGLNPEDTELGFGLIRPQFMRSAAAYRLNWLQVVVANAWSDWFFEGAGAPFLVGQDFGLCITHLKSLVTPTPFASECRFTVGRRGVLVTNDLRSLRLADTTNNIPIVAVPTIISKPRSSFYARIRGDAVGGNDEIAPGGLIFGLGRVLTPEVATWV